MKAILVLLAILSMSAVFTGCDLPGDPTGPIGGDDPVQAP